MFKSNMAEISKYDPNTESAKVEARGRLLQDDEFVKAMGGLAAKISNRYAEAAANGDPNAIADQTRLLHQLASVSSSEYKRPETPEEADAEFAHLPFSGEQAGGFLEGALDTINHPVASEVRSRLGLPEVDPASMPVPETPQEEAEALTADEAPIAALIIANGVKATQAAEQTGSVVTIDRLLNDDEAQARIEATVLGDRTLFPGSRSEQRKLIKSAYEKLTRLTRRERDKWARQRARVAA
jgi:hypothetical protein